MSNDATFWLWRIINLALLTLDGSFLWRGVSVVIGAGRMTARAIMWLVISFIAIAANVAAYMRYRRAKTSRWADTAKTPLQSEVEILAAYAKQQRIDESKRKTSTPSHTTTP